MFYVLAAGMRIKLTGLGSLERKLVQKTRMPIFKCTSFYDNASRNKLDTAIASENAANEAEFGLKRHVLTRDGNTVYLTSRGRGFRIMLR